MRTITALLSLLVLGGCTSTPPVTQSCLTDPPPASDTFMVGMCRTLISLPERDRIQAREWSRLSRLPAPPEPMAPRIVTTIDTLDAELEQLERYAMPAPVTPTTPGGVSDWLLYQTPHGTYTNLGNGWMMGPDGLYVPY